MKVLKEQIIENLKKFVNSFVYTNAKFLISAF